MKIKALGAVGTVTGSCFRLEMESGDRVLLDCGLFQGGRQTELRNFNTKTYEPDNLSAIVLTHAHMDHTGLVPRLVKAGYRGPVYATDATCELLRVLWLDAAHIQELEAEWKSRKNARQGKAKVEPLYTEDDARQAMTLLKPIKMEAPFEVVPNLLIRFFSAGHILGAASVHFTATENDQTRRVVFSGDIGRTGQLLMPDPSEVPETDTVFMETTYGNRLHKDLVPSIDEFVDVINEAYKDGGKVLVPAFAVERTQELLLLLAKAWQAGRIPQDMPIYLDSPLAAQASEIYARHVHLFDAESQSFLADGITHQTLPTLKITKDSGESQKLNELKGPALIMAGSGMANAGRILHHFKHNIWRSNCHIIFVGFQAQGTTGRRLVEGAKVIKLFRESFQVEAKIHTIGGFSGHADQKELLAWLGRIARPGLTVNLIHGEATSTQDFYKLAKKEFPELKFHIPTWLHYTALADEIPPTPDSQAAEISTKTDKQPGNIAPSLARRLERLQSQTNSADQLSPEQLTQLESFLTQAEEILARHE